jgi:hypothetical protein
MHIYSAIFAALLLLSPTLADFHIGTQFGVYGTQPNPPTTTEYIACPSNYYNCNCYGAMNPDRGVLIQPGTNPGSATFYLKSGLCGMGQLDFYYQQSKGGWDIYVNGGDGSLQGTCYPNSDTQHCSFLPLFTSKYTDNLICYTHICN